MKPVAIAIVCKTPTPGRSKTRLSPPLLPEECAAISACFIRDLANTISEVAKGGNAVGYALYTPIGTEVALRRLLPDDFAIIPQFDGDFGERLFQGVTGLLAGDHKAAVLVNSDSPTLPSAILRSAVDALQEGDSVVLSPAADGGYTLIGLRCPHKHLFEDIPWSTDRVYDLTRRRAREVGIPIVELAGWYDVDDETSLQILADEFVGVRPNFSELNGADAPTTRRFLLDRQSRAASQVE